MFTKIDSNKKIKYFGIILIDNRNFQNEHITKI